jgi:hypothetical protein
MHNILTLATIYQKKAQQQVQLSPVKITDYTNTIIQIAEKALDKMGLTKATVDVKPDTASDKGYNVSVVANNYYNDSKQWVRPSDIFRFVLDNLARHFAFDPSITFNVNVPVDQSKMTQQTTNKIV